MLKRVTVAFIALVALLCPGCGHSGSPTAGAKKLTIAVVPKGTTHEFWKSIHAGAIKAARELSAQGTEVEVIWKGPLREDDREQQIQVVEGFIAQGVNGLVLAPLDNRALVRPVEEAQRAGLPTVIIDSGLESANIVSFVATDNRKGGRLAATRLGELMGGKGKALLLRYQEGSASTEEREAGFLEEMKAKYPGVTVISSDQYAGATRDTAKRTSENLLNRFGDDLQGIFTPNESSTAGMLLALQDAMNAKQLHGIVVQNPFHMGYLGVRTMVEQLQGKSVAKLLDTGVEIITPENLNTPQSQALLKPPINDYLN
jgi:ribose transport system substrate-binding protein